MRTNSRYKKSRRSGCWPSLFFGLMACAGLGLFGWILHRTAIRPPRSDSHRIPTPAPPRPAPPRPAPPRPAPPPRSAPTNAPAVIATPRRAPQPASIASNAPVPPLVASAPTSQPPPLALVLPSAATNPPWVTNPLPPAARPSATNPPSAPLPPATNLPASSPAAPSAITPPPATPPTRSPDRPRSVLDTQLALARLGYSPGSLDGIAGTQTRAALGAFQRANGLPITGRADAATWSRLLSDAPQLTTYELTAGDLARLRPLSATWLGKSQQDRLDYETVLELVAERFQAHPALIRSLNPGVDWERPEFGLRLTVPNVSPPVPDGAAASVHIRLSDRTLEARDEQDRLLAHFPCSIARLVEKRPVGILRVVVIIQNPSYTFNPAVFPESEEGQRLGRKLIIPPGPNNPVGIAWIGLDRPGYGIHGTPRPEEVGRTESHGCFRLANWNAAYLARLVRVGTPVHVDPF